ncbi:MAG: hypothetical protein BGP25_05280 [Lysobacterales bacterium 63-13]|nr:MAG: hypothetical protein BGP25_05280 [Xanthomonadales bacterium 63-13]
MQIEGMVVEMGNLDGRNTPGIRVLSEDRLVEIVGLRTAELTTLPPLLYRVVTLTLGPSLDPPESLADTHAATRYQRLELAVKKHVADLERCADLLKGMPTMRATAAEILLAAQELREACR